LLTTQRVTFGVTGTSRPRPQQTTPVTAPCERRNARFPPFRCRSSVAVSPFPLAVAVSITPLPLPLPLPLRISAVYGCNVIFTEQRNFTKAERRNGNGRTATEWWKPGITNSY